ncbi:MAG: LytR C-terminal domain-containing protein [Patescibacteria group bacterium]|nr:LytR C-terminal domain-containing protein [Patescibacteria group bacterium]
MENELSNNPNFNQEITPGAYNQENGSNKLLFVIIALIILVAGGVLFFKIKSGSSQNEVANSLTPTVTEAMIATATPSPTTPVTSVTGTPALTSKQQLKIEILNGTGKAGEAAYLKGQLSNAGFGTFTLGNADSFATDSAGQVTFYANFPQNLRIDTVGLLENIYASVSSQVTTDPGKFDAVIVTGKRK